MERHRREAAHLRGNDLRYNVYMRKLNKLTRMDLGLDMEAYKDYINNLKQFAHLNSDFDMFAKEALGTDRPEFRELAELRFNPSASETGEPTDGESLLPPEDMHLFNRRCQDIYNTLRKLRREASGFLSKRDHELIADLKKHMRHYLRHVEV